jgi:hypothetical protein
MDFERLGLLLNPDGPSSVVWGPSITLTYRHQSFLWPLVHQRVEATVEDFWRRVGQQPDATYAGLCLRQHLGAPTRRR